MVVRGQRVMLDSDLATLFGVSTKRLNEQVKRNVERFPPDFMFRLSAGETAGLDRSQFATGSQKHRDPRFSPYAFTEHGALMAANVLNSPRAIEVSVYVMRAFVELREMLASNRVLALKLKELEQRLERRLDEHDQAIVEILRAIRQLMAPPELKKKRPIGFVLPEEKQAQDGRARRRRRNPSESLGTLAGGRDAATTAARYSASRRNFSR
jgi:hypothetical protein